MAYTSTQIREGLVSNDPEVFRYLYRAYGGMITGYVKKNSGTDQDAREMVQTVLLELWQAVRDGRYREEGKLERFVYILCSNSWRDELRRRRVRQTDTLDPAHIGLSDDGDMSIAAAVVRDQRIEAIHQCLQQLDAPCDDIIRLYHLQEVSLQEVAVRMNYDYNNLRKRIFDCRKKLKKLVDDFLKRQTPLQQEY